jgi:hypothetical protein
LARANLVRFFKRLEFDHVKRESFIMKNIFKRKKSQKGSGGFLIAPASSAQINFLDLRKDCQFIDEESALPVVVSFGTRDGKYDSYAYRLQHACEQNGMQSSIETIPSCSRENACLFKPTFIKFKILTLGSPIVWLDADAMVYGKFQLPSQGWDVGFVQNNRQSDVVNAVAAFCVAFQPSIAALRLLEHWEQLCAAHWLKPGLDHRRLNYARHILSGYFQELDIGNHMEGKIARDVGRNKEYRL